MEQFKIRQDGFKEIRKALLVQVISLSLIAIIGGMAMSHFSGNEDQRDVNVFPVLIPIVLGAMAFGLYRGVQRQKTLFDSYVLTIDDSGITREQYNTSTITISNSDIKKIVKNSNGSYTIKGNSSANIIVIPSQINDYEKFEKLLFDLGPISVKTKESLLQKFRIPISLLALGLMGIVYIAKDKIIVGITGTILLVFFIYSTFAIQRSKNIDNKTKKASWWVLLMIGSIIITMYAKLTEQQ